MDELAIYKYVISFFDEDGIPVRAEGTVMAEDEEHAIDTLEDWYSSYSFVDVEVEFLNTLEFVQEESRYKTGDLKF
jgi:hypothetical protein